MPCVANLFGVNNCLVAVSLSDNKKNEIGEIEIWFRCEGIELVNLSKASKWFIVLLELPIRIKAIVPCLQILKAPFLWLVRPLLKATLVVDETTVGGDSSGWQDHFYRQL